MTSIDSWPDWIAISVVGAPGLFSIVGVAFSLYISRRHSDALTEALKNSRFMYFWGPRLGQQGLIWSLMEISRVAGLVMWSRTSLRCGELDPADFENFPPHLKRLLVVNTAIMGIGFIWAVIMAVLIKFK